MNERQRKLISILQSKSSPVTGKKLGKELNITRRTVINDINSINSENREQIILSSEAGYYLNHSNLKKEGNGIPQNRIERTAYLVHVLMLEHPEGVNVFDLSNDLLISYSLLKKEINDFNQQYRDMGVAIVSHSNVLQIEGNERQKRKLMTSMIHRQQGDSMLDIEQLRVYFGAEMIDDILAIFKRHIDKSDVYINDFSKMNLILHVVIAVSRVCNGNTLSDIAEYPALPSTPLKDVAEDIIHEIEMRFHVHLSSGDHFQLLALLESHMHTASTPVWRVNSEYADQLQLRFLKEIMEEVAVKYYLDFSNYEFLVPFSLHVQNMLIRLDKNIRIENPIKETFRNSSPFLYDIAWFIAEEILKRNNIDKEVDDNELTFIVMHLELELQRQQINDSTIKALLYFPHYLGIEKDLATKIQTHFEEQMTIIGTVSSEDDILQNSYDLLITFVKPSSRVSGRIVHISPMLSTTDWGNISDALTQAQHEKLMSHFRNVFPLFFDPKNYLTTEKKDIDKSTAIHMICDRLCSNNYTGTRFELAVQDREKAISTAYLNFAAPHAVSTEVYSETIGVLMAPNGIMWDSKIIRGVFLMAIRPDHLADFQHMYNGLLLLLLETNIVERISSSSDFDTFRKIMLNQAANFH